MITSLPLTSTARSIDGPVHRIFCIDCSGSMAGDLDAMRTHLKNKIPTAIRPHDFLTIIWFSGRGECGTVIEHVSLTDLADLSAVHTAIDRYLHTVGSTGFVDPIRLGSEIAQKYNEVAQLFFLTDGGENSYDRDTCREAFRAIATLPIAFVIVEYGYCADRAFLTELSECSGATLIFNEDFERYSTSFDSYMKNRVVSDRYDAFSSLLPVLYLTEGALTIVRPGEIRLPLSVEMAWSVDASKGFAFPTEERMAGDPLVADAYLAMLYGLQTRSHTVMKTCVESLGDVALAKAYAGCFSRQDYARLTDYVQGCVANCNLRFAEGVDLAFRVKEDSFTVIQLLQLLADPASRLSPYHPSFVYRRVAKETVKTGPRFVANRELGSAFGIIFHQSRANLSLGCVVHGHSVTETDDVTPEIAYRNYTILKDGIKNVDTIPVAVSEAVFARLVAEGCIAPGVEWKRGTVYPIEIRHLPVVNRIYASRRIEASHFGGLHLRLHHLKSELKFLKARQEKEEKEEKTSDEEKKVREKREDAQRDFYIAPELQIKIKGCSTIPPINDRLLTKLASGKVTPSEQLLMDVWTEFGGQGDQGDQGNHIKEAIATRVREQQALVATLEDMKMALLIAGVWFEGMEMTETTFSTEYRGRPYEIAVEINDVKVYLD